jgi:hypothetical protein
MAVSTTMRQRRDDARGRCLLLSRLFLFKKNRNYRAGGWYYRFVTTGTVMPGTTTIYDPPKEGLPYLVVTFTPEGMKITTANSSLAARTIASERVIGWRRERQSEHSKAIDGSNVT